MQLNLDVGRWIVPKSLQVMLRVIPVCVAVSVLALADGQEKATHDGSTAKIELLLGEGKAKVISVALGQSAREVFNLCKPAKVYADDDPWLGCMAAGGGHYVLFFQAEGADAFGQKVAKKIVPAILLPPRPIRKVWILGIVAIVLQAETVEKAVERLFFLGLGPGDQQGQKKQQAGHGNRAPKRLRTILKT